MTSSDTPTSSDTTTAPAAPVHAERRRSADELRASRTAVAMAVNGSLPPDPERTAEHRRFLRRVMLFALTVVLLVGAVNWYVDPTGVTGRETPWRIADNAAVRSQKVDLYLALEQAPEVVLLGSSRTMKFEPSVIEQLTGDRAFNGAVSGGVPQDALLFTRMLAAEQGDDFPHLVWGLDAAAFRDKQLRLGLATDRRLRKYVPVRERIMGQVAAVGSLLEWQTTKATVRALRRGVRSDAAPLVERTYSADGYQEWELPRPERGRELVDAVRRQTEQFIGFIFERDGYTGIVEEPRRDFEAVIRIANEHGDEPTLFLAPYHPLAEEMLDEHGMDERVAEVRTLLADLKARGRLRFEVVDLSDLSSFDGDPDGYYDGVHMTTDNTQRMLRELDRRGVLAAK